MMTTATSSSDESIRRRGHDDEGSVKDPRLVNRRSGEVELR